MRLPKIFTPALVTGKSTDTGIGKKIIFLREIEIEGFDAVHLRVRGGYPD